VTTISRSFRAKDVHVSNCSLFSFSAAVRLEDTRYSTFSNLSITPIEVCRLQLGEEHTAHVLFPTFDGDQPDHRHWWGKAEPIYIAARKGTEKRTSGTFHEYHDRGRRRNDVYGAPDSIVRDIYLEQVRMHVRAPQQRIAQSDRRQLDLRWTATSLSEAIFKHDIPALYVRYGMASHSRLDLSWGDNLPA